MEDEKDPGNPSKLPRTGLEYEKSMLEHLLKKPDDFVGAFKTLPNSLQLLMVHSAQSLHSITPCLAGWNQECQSSTCEGIWLHRFSLTEGSTLVRWPESAVRTLLGANEIANSGGLQLLESCLGVIPIMRLSPVISKSKASMLQASLMWTGS